MPFRTLSPVVEPPVRRTLGQARKGGSEYLGDLEIAKTVASGSLKITVSPLPIAVSISGQGPAWSGARSEPERSCRRHTPRPRRPPFALGSSVILRERARAWRSLRGFERGRASTALCPDGRMSWLRPKGIPICRLYLMKRVIKTGAIH